MDADFFKRVDKYLLEKMKEQEIAEVAVEEVEEETHAHTHAHTHKQTKAVVNRMARLIGHLQATKKMIEDGRDCSEVLIQLSAVNAAIKAVSRVILKDHIEHCIVEAVKENDQESIDRLNQAIDQILK